MIVGAKFWAEVTGISLLELCMTLVEGVGVVDEIF
jgi:hypothetical protein